MEVTLYVVFIWYFIYVELDGTMVSTLGCHSRGCGVRATRVKFGSAVVHAPLADLGIMSTSTTHGQWKDDSGTSNHEWQNFDKKNFDHK